MRVIARNTLSDFWRIHPRAQRPLMIWLVGARRARWKSPASVKRTFGSASVIGNNRVVFNIAGNRYRLVTAIHYNRGIVYIRFVGSHAQYDRINAETV